MSPPPNEFAASAAAATALLDATRRLLRITGPTEVRDITVTFVTRMGGTVIADHEAAALAVDLSFGVGVPIFPSAPAGSDARLALEQYLPSLMTDAARALELTGYSKVLADAAAIDQLTGLPNRMLLDRTLGRLRDDDTVVLIDLDHFEGVDAEHGVGAGDEILRVFGRVLRSTSRGRDVVGRFDTEEFVAVLAGGGNATAFLRRLLTEWNDQRPQPITFSAGIVHPTGDADHTIALVDQAVTLAKEAGAGRWVWIPGGMVPEELGPDQVPHPGTMTF